MPGMTTEIPAAQADLLHRMCEIFTTQKVEKFTRAFFHPDVDWPNVAEGTRLHGIEAVLAYWRGQFAELHPLVRMEGMTAEPDGRIAVRVRLGARGADGDHRAEGTVHHVYPFRDGKVVHMEVREGWRRPLRGRLRGGQGAIGPLFREPGQWQFVNSSRTKAGRARHAAADDRTTGRWHGPGP
ncbi:nuclear transport factor 2 family protein [Streptomyces halobius]|uniref:Nuclear transport factor 2 family protein n=1 Tax=Streptomyces halobius TaxID=2879846 RepID=A0ABY4M5T4_9ACTN|nr:nuclear transport factor 2 family protein [Streptomyces halobius]UQA93126.1 nuclear transport factor 2 family protein [Streptomyces halobius]